MSETRALLEEIEIKVRWSDMDAVGHVNNAVYFTYFEQARVAWLERLAMTSGIGASALVGPVVVNACCTFHRPIAYPAQVIVQMFAGDIGRSSLETFYELHDVQRKVHYASGGAKVVWVNHREGRSTPLPIEVRRLLQRPVT